MKIVLRISLALLAVFAGFALIVEALAYISWRLTPRDAASLERAAGFEASVGRLRDPAAVASPRTHDENTDRRVHTVGEWSGGAEFDEAPMLRALVESGGGSDIVSGVS